MYNELLWTFIQLPQHTSDKKIEKQAENDPYSYIPTDEELKEFKRVHNEEEK